jgi:hypothetical protein
MKYIYVLVSTPLDLYYEQFLLSVVSLRLFNPHAEIILLTDTRTKSTLCGRRVTYEKIVSETKVVELPEKFTQKEVSRFLKTAINTYINGDFLYIDCDTVVTSSLDFEFPSSIKIGAVLDCHVPVLQHPFRYHFEREDKLCGFISSEGTGRRYNGGLIYYRASHESALFFEKWHSHWLESREKVNGQDMPALNQANCELDEIITELDGEWNCQISNNGLPYLSSAKIIHYFGSTNDVFETPYLLGRNDVLLSIKEGGVIPDRVLELLQNPCAAFSLQSRVLADENLISVINSSLFSLSFWLCRKHKPLFNKLDRFLSNISAFVKKMKPFSC